MVTTRKCKFGGVTRYRTTKYLHGVAVHGHICRRFPDRNSFDTARNYDTIDTISWGFCGVSSLTPS